MNTKIKNSIMPLLYSLILVSAGNFYILSAHSTAHAMASAVESDYRVEPWMDDVSYWNTRITDIAEKEITVSAWMVNVNYWNTVTETTGLPGLAGEDEMSVEDWMIDLERWGKNRKLCINDRRKAAGVPAEGT